MGKQRVTNQTVVILDHRQGFFFFDPRKEGVIFDFRRLCREDTNVSRDRAPSLIERMTQASGIQIDLKSLRWLSSFTITEKGLLLPWEKRITIRPVVVTTTTEQDMTAHRGLSPLATHPYYLEFPQVPSSLHAVKSKLKKHSVA